MTRIGLDAIDIRILGAVQKHGPLSRARLSELVNLSPTPCWARLKRLEAAGIIRGYGADIAVERIAHFTEVVVTVSLSRHRKADFDRFETEIRRLDEITECVATGGGMDYVLKVSSPNMAAFQELMSRLLESELGIDRYMTYIVTRRIKTAAPNLARLVPRPRG